MDRMLKVKLPMQVRLDDFLRAHPFGDGPADEIVARFREKVARQQVFIALQEEAENSRGFVPLKSTRATPHRA